MSYFGGHGCDGFVDCSSAHITHYRRSPPPSPPLPPDISNLPIMGEGWNPDLGFPMFPEGGSGKPLYPDEMRPYPGDTPYCPGDDGWHKHVWVQSSEGKVPQGATHAGRDLGGAPIFVGRVHHDGELIPAKVVPAWRCAFYPHDGRELQKYEYEVMESQHVAWEEDKDGNVPRHAVPVGKNYSGEPIYMGRVKHEGTLTPGKIHRCYGGLVISYGGMEIPYKHYEVLVNVKRM